MTSVDTLISNASSSLTSTIGFDPSTIVTWMATNLLEPFIGSGLLVLYDLRYWIVGLIVISAIVYFAFRGFGFFKH